MNELPRREVLTAVAVVVAVTAVVWGASLWVGFFLDDVHNLERAVEAPWTPAGLASGFSVFDPRTLDVWCADRHAVTFFRPLFVLSLKLDHALFGTWAAGFHGTNLALHALNAFLIWLMLRAVGLRRGGALLAAGLFAGFAHHTVAVIWISGRTELLLATFVLASVVCHLRALAGGRWGWRVASWGLAACALATKENAVLLPVYLALAEWLAAGRRWPTRVQLEAAARRLIPVVALTAAYLMLRLGVMGLGAPPPKPYFVSPADAAFPAFVAVKTIYYYLAWLAFVPILPVAPVAFLTSHLPLLIGVALVTLAGWGAVAWVLRGEARLPALLLWTAACQVPVAMQMASNHYVYLGSVGVVVLLALLLSRGGEFGLRRRLALAAVAVACVLHAAFGHVTYLGLCTANERLTRGVVAVDPELLDGDAELYLVNLPYLAAHQGQRLRVLHGAGGLRAHLLTVSSDPSGVGPPPQLRWRDEQTLELALPGGLLPGELGEMFALMGADVWPEWEHPAGPAVVIPHEDADGVVRRLTVEFAPGAEPHVVVYRPAPGDRLEVVRSTPQGDRAAVVDPRLFGATASVSTEASRSAPARTASRRSR